MHPLVTQLAWLCLLSLRSCQQSGVRRGWFDDDVNQGETEYRSFQAELLGMSTLQGDTSFVQIASRTDSRKPPPWLSIGKKSEQGTCCAANDQLFVKQEQPLHSTSRCQKHCFLHTSMWTYSACQVKITRDILLSAARFGTEVHILINSRRLLLWDGHWYSCFVIGFFFPHTAGKCCNLMFPCGSTASAVHASVSICPQSN